MHLAPVCLQLSLISICTDRYLCSMTLHSMVIELEVDCAPGAGSTLRSMVSQSLSSCSLLTTCECLPEVALVGLL